MRKGLKWGCGCGCCVPVLFLVALTVFWVVVWRERLLHGTADGVTYTYAFNKGTVWLGNGHDGSPCIDTNTVGELRIPSRLWGFPVRTVGAGAFRRCSGLTSVVIPDSVRRIQTAAFAGCSGLTSVMIPNSVTNIEAGAFVWCGGLTSVTIPQGVVSIRQPEMLFAGCSNLKTIVVDEGNPSYASMDGMLFDKAGTRLLAYPEGKPYTDAVLERVEVIGTSVFARNNRITAVDIPQGVWLIDEKAFFQCRQLTSVALPESIQVVGNAAFAECGSLESITVDPENSFYSSIDGVLFNDDRKQRRTRSNEKSTVVLRAYPCARQGAYTVPEGVDQICNAAFKGANELTSLTLPASVTLAAPGFIDTCSSLKEIIVDAGNPDYLSKDGVLFSKDGTRLLAYPNGKRGTYVVPDGVKVIEKDVFREHRWLTSLTLSSSVESIDPEFIATCSNLVEIAVDANNPIYSAVDGVLFDNDSCALIACLKGKQGDYVIPDNVTRIGKGAFEGCSELTSVTIPDNVEIIEGDAFYKCTGLMSIILPDSVRSVEWGTFGQCSNLRSVTIPASVTNVSYWSFGGCTNITSITIPACVRDRDLKYVFTGAHKQITNVVRHAVNKE